MLCSACVAETGIRAVCQLLAAVHAPTRRTPSCPAGENCYLRRCVVDENASIGNNVQVGGTSAPALAPAAPCWLGHSQAVLGGAGGAGEWRLRAEGVSGGLTCHRCNSGDASWTPSWTEVAALNCKAARSSG